MLVKLNACSQPGKHAATCEHECAYCRKVRLSQCPVHCRLLCRHSLSTGRTRDLSRPNERPRPPRGATGLPLMHHQSAHWHSPRSAKVAVYTSSPKQKVKHHIAPRIKPQCVSIYLSLWVGHASTHILDVGHGRLEPHSLQVGRRSRASVLCHCWCKPHAACVDINM